MQKNTFYYGKQYSFLGAPNTLGSEFLFCFFLRTLVGCVGRGFIQAITPVCHQSLLVYIHVLSHSLTQSTLNHKVQDSFSDKKRKVMSKTILVLATLIVENSLKKVLAPTRLPKHFIETVFFKLFYLFEH